VYKGVSIANDGIQRLGLKLTAYLQHVTNLKVHTCLVLALDPGPANHFCIQINPCHSGACPGQQQTKVSGAATYI
jgi:hypothetical protein